MDVVYVTDLQIYTLLVSCDAELRTAAQGNMPELTVSRVLGTLRPKRRLLQRRDRDADDQVRRRAKGAAVLHLLQHKRVPAG